VLLSIRSSVYPGEKPLLCTNVRATKIFSVSRIWKKHDTTGAPFDRPDVSNNVRNTALGVAAAMRDALHVLCVSLPPRSAKHHTAAASGGKRRDAFHAAAAAALPQP